jgi:putative MATE family efflux protein
MAGPMVLGIGAIILFNVVDTIFVGRLGADALAAMSFTFPVTSIVMSLAQGLGLGLTSVVSRLMGEGDTDSVRRITTHGLLLANTLVVLVAIAGFFSIEPVFALVGAPDELMPMIGDYMKPWYLAIGFLVIPMLGNGAIRASGDTKTPSFVMLSAGLVNVILDPIFIFGLGPIPAMGLAGAAYATAASWTLIFFLTLYILGRRLRLIELAWHGMGELLDSWKRILHIGLPAAGTNLLVPVSSGLVTRLVASYGSAAVAAYGVGLRLESLGMIGIFSLSMAVTPFVGQNFGAHQCGRVREAVSFGVKSCLAYGLGVALLYGLGSHWLALAFSEEAPVREIVQTYLWILPITWGCYGLALMINAVYNAMDRPLYSSGLIVVRLFVLILPLAYLGAELGGLRGVFIGLAAANLCIGGLAWFTMHRFLGVAEADPHEVIGPKGELPLLPHRRPGHPVPHAH